MRRTFGYLAKKIVDAYDEANAAKHDFWEMSKRAKADGNTVSEELYNKIGNDHARKADALLDLIIQEGLATTDEIIAIDHKNMLKAKK